jgi:hypothetical protein
MSTKVTVKAAVNVPKVPNFLRYGGGTIDVAHVADEYLRELGAAWTEELIANAQRRRKTKGGTA